MKNIILFASILTAASSHICFAQCSKSPTPSYGTPIHRIPHHSTRPIWQPPQHRPTSVTDKHVAKLPQVTSGRQITINGTSLGRTPGRIMVKVGPVTMEGRVTTWSDSEVTVVMPTLPLSNSVTATIYVRTAQQQTADTLTIELLPPPQVPELTTVNPGQAITLESVNLGSQSGQVRLLIGGLTLAASVQNWSNSKVVAVLPNIPVTSSNKATVQIVRPDGSVADQIDVNFAAPTANVAVR